MSIHFKRKRLFRVFAMCAVAVAVFGAAKYLRIIQLANAQVKAVPFFLQLELSQPGADGTMTVFRRITTARRSDGSTTLIETVGPVSAGQTARRVTFLDGRSISLVDAFRLKSTWPAQRPEEVAYLKARLSEPQGNCMPRGKTGDTTFLGMESLHGESVAVIRSSEGGYRLTRWVAPRLGCQPLQYRSEKLHPDGLATFLSEAKAVTFILGEPDPRFFEAGEDYQEVLPSVIQSRSAAQAGLEETQELKDSSKKMDDRYRRGR